MYIHVTSVLLVLDWWLRDDPSTDIACDQGLRYPNVYHVCTSMSVSTVYISMSNSCLCTRVNLSLVWQVFSCRELGSEKQLLLTTNANRQTSATLQLHIYSLSSAPLPWGFSSYVVRAPA